MGRSKMPEGDLKVLVNFDLDCRGMHSKLFKDENL